MQHKNYLILLFLIIAFGAWGQTCPGPANRQALINLQKSGILNGTRAYQIPMTDTCGNQRYVTIDSIITIVVDSIGSDTALQRNWYTHDGTTVNPLRTATIDSAAQWIGNNADGFLYFQMGTLAGGRAYIDTDESSIFFGDLGGMNTVETNTTGIDIITSATSSRAVDLTTDTVNMIASFDPTLMTVNLLSDGTYFSADSLKIVGLGQFPGFPSLNFDGTEKGFFYDPIIEEESILLMNGDGISGSFSYVKADPTTASLYANADATITDDVIVLNDPEGSASSLTISVREPLSNQNSAFNQLTLSDTENHWATYFNEKDTNKAVVLFMAENLTSGENTVPYGGRRAFGVKTQLQEEPFEVFYWILSYLPNDTIENAVSFYNRAYYWRNEHPTGAAGDTLFHFWAATGAGGEAGSDPGFMTLDSIRGPGGGDNWYTADGTTTDPHRIATVSGRTTWTSADTTGDGSVPFRFVVDGGVENEPEALVIKFTNPEADSLLFSKSDQEIFMTSDAPFVLFGREIVTFQADSLVIEQNTVEADDEGDLLVLIGADASNRTVKTLEGTFNADQLSWAAGAAGDKWEAVPANRTSIATTTVNLIPAESQVEIIVTPTGGGTVELNYTPAMPAAGYTTTRWIYNAAAGATTVETDQDWQFQDSTGDLGADFVLAAGENCKLIWIYNATAADARFFVVKL